jgi:hypothetical protein
MKPEEVFSDPRVKGKARSTSLANALSKGKMSGSELARYGAKAGDAERAICLEAIEFATRENPKKAGREGFLFAVDSLSSKAPAVKREAGRVIANAAAAYPGLTQDAIPALLKNAVHESTVVRWSAAMALSVIILLDIPSKGKLLPRVGKLAKAEEKDSIRKIYLKALTKFSIQA